MEDPQRRRSGGRAARQALRLATHAEHIPFLTRKLKPFEVLNEEGLSLIEENADTILQEVGLEFPGDPPTRSGSSRDAGADVQGERVRFPRGMCRSIVQATAPRQFTQYARNPERNVEIGGMHTVFAPNYGSPFVRDLDRGRRYGTIEDFRNFVKLAYASPYLHHSGGTVCEPVDVPVNKRHLDMVYSHIRYSDKPFMGSVTAPERARDTVEMARLTFGADYLEDHAVILSLINANSPLVWDSVMLCAARAYAEANQATLLTPFILAGAMAPVTAAGVCAQTLAEALGGMTFVQLVRPGAPVVLGPSWLRLSKRPAPDARTAEPALFLTHGRPVARRLGVPFRSGGSLCGSKIADAQAAYESRRRSSRPSSAASTSSCTRPGWLEGGLAVGYEKFILDADQCGMMAVFVNGVDMSENGQALDAIRANAPGTRITSAAPTRWPTSRPPSTAPRSPTTTATSSGRRTGRSTRRSGPTRSGSGCWPTTRRRRSTRGSTRRCSSSWPGARQSPRRGKSGRSALFRRRRALSPEVRRSPSRGSCEQPTFELIPLKNSMDQAALLPAGATVSVTASPAKGIEATIVVLRAAQAQ